MGNYNVAWELKNDVAAGANLLELPEDFLTVEERYAIQQLLDELKKIPNSVLNEATNPEDNLWAMRHPCWEPLRKHAGILLRTLNTRKDSSQE